MNADVSEREPIEIVARPAQADWVIARIGLFLRGSAVLAWIGASVLFFAAWVLARAKGAPIPAQIVLPILLLLVCWPIVFVVAGSGSKRVRAAIANGVAMRFDEEGIVIDGARSSWRQVRDVFEIARVVVIVDRAGVHVVPRSAFATVARMRAFRALVAARRRDG